MILLCVSSDFRIHLLPVQYKSGFFAIVFFLLYRVFLLLLRIFFDFTIFPTQIHRVFLHRIILPSGVFACFCWNQSMQNTRFILYYICTYVLE